MGAGSGAVGIGTELGGGRERAIEVGVENVTQFVAEPLGSGVQVG